MIDIHNHILPNIDDGPTNETEMMDLLRQATTQGVTEIIVTSHHLHPFVICTNLIKKSNLIGFK
ncbi:CpsB/CapC family capsule biosynthesis tyrosine phosphatase, partial [Staphylococcus aureus]